MTDYNPDYVTNWRRGWRHSQVFVWQPMKNKEILLEVSPENPQHQSTEFWFCFFPSVCVQCSRLCVDRVVSLKCALITTGGSQRNERIGLLCMFFLLLLLFFSSCLNNNHIMFDDLNILQILIFLWFFFSCVLVSSCSPAGVKCWNCDSVKMWTQNSLFGFFPSNNSFDFVYLFIWIWNKTCKYIKM